MDVVLPTAHSAPYTEEPVRFTGTGGEYFRIWIVNLLLTIVTLGIYSAWAKVRRLHYFYRHTELAGSSFDFHGAPVRILIGRIIALVMLGGYNYAVRLQSWWTLAVVLVAALVLPWLLRNSLRFRLYNTSWRGTRFHFRGSLQGAYRVFLVNPALTALTLYILAPFTHQRMKAYQHGNSWFGQTPFSFTARVGRFYLAYLLVLVGILGVGALVFVFSLLTQQKVGLTGSPQTLLANLAIIWGAVVVASLSIGPIFQAVITNLIWSNTSLGEHRIQCEMPILGLIWVTISNFVLIVVTLGLFYPWAMVRMTRFKLECFTLFRTTDLQEFVDLEPEAVGAIGEEAASIFDIDIAL